MPHQCHGTCNHGNHASSTVTDSSPVYLAARVPAHPLPRGAVEGRTLADRGNRGTGTACVWCRNLTAPQSPRSGTPHLDTALLSGDRREIKPT